MLTRMPEDVFHFILGHAVPEDVREPGIRVEVVADTTATPYSHQPVSIHRITSWNRQEDPAPHISRVHWLINQVSTSASMCEVRRWAEG
jgi:hypothetical protein